MHVVEIFMPLETGKGQPVSPHVIEGIVAGLADRFGGATAFTRSPAEGLWKQEDEVQRDQIVIVEVMVSELDERWWSDYRRKLESEFQQDEVLIRASPCCKL